MKRVLDFFYCPGTFTANVVWYQVHCGRALADQRARRRLAAIVRGNRAFFLADHSEEMCSFRAHMAAQALPMCSRPVALLRSKQIGIVQLVRFLTHCPAALLNSAKIDTPVKPAALILAGYRSSAEIVMSRRASARHHETRAIRKTL